MSEKKENNIIFAKINEKVNYFEIMPRKMPKSEL